jgi:hypothetical protein
MKPRTGNGVLAHPLTSALYRGEWSTPRFSRFDPLKRPIRTVQKAGGPRPGAENLPPSVFEPRTVQPVESRYTDCAIAAHYSMGV